MESPDSHENGSEANSPASLLMMRNSLFGKSGNMPTSEPSVSQDSLKQTSCEEVVAYGSSMHEADSSKKGTDAIQVPPNQEEEAEVTKPNGTDSPQAVEEAQESATLEEDVSNNNAAENAGKEEQAESVAPAPSEAQETLELSSTADIADQDNAHNTSEAVKEDAECSQNPVEALQETNAEDVGQLPTESKKDDYNASQDVVDADTALSVEAENPANVTAVAATDVSTNEETEESNAKIDEPEVVELPTESDDSERNKEAEESANVECPSPSSQNVDEPAVAELPTANDDSEGNKVTDEAAGIETPKTARRTRGRVSATPKNEVKTPTMARSSRTTRSTVKSSDENAADENPESEETPRRTRASRAQPVVASKTQKTPKQDSDKEETTEAETPKRATRSGRKASAPSSVSESSKEDAEEGTPVLQTRSRRSTAKNSNEADSFSGVSTHDKEVAAAAASETPKPKKSASAPTASAKKQTITPKRSVSDAVEHDPYDLDTEMEKHPEPLKNIKMAVQSFGGVKYEKVGSGKYEQTEKTAEMRTGNLFDMVPKNKGRFSLGDLTPGRGKKGHFSKDLAKSAPQTRRGRGHAKKTEDDDDEEPMDVEEHATKTPSRKRRQSPAMQTPAKKMAVDLPKLNENEQWEVDHPQDDHAPFEPGARVFAAFAGTFYPAIVLVGSRDELGRTKVQFVEDQVVKDIPVSGIIPLRAVVADSSCLRSSDMSSVSVLRSPNAASAAEWKNGIFSVISSDDDSKTEDAEEADVSWADLALGMSDWKGYVNKLSSQATAVVTENISSNGRSTRRSAVVTTPSVSVPSTPKTKTPKSAVSKRGGKSKVATTEDAETESAVQPSDDTPKEQAESNVELPSLFDGKIFILTSAMRAQGETTFKKKLMSDFIVQSKGMVVEDFAQVDENPTKQAFLISDTHYRTHKYLSAMARAVPCVSHEWILECHKTGSLVDYKDYVLPAGVSIIDEKSYPLPTKPNELFKGKVVLVHSNNRPSGGKHLNFVEIWSPLVKLLGGTSITEAGEDKIDFLLTDSSASPEVLERAQKDGAVVASSEWAIQGIIMDKLPDVNAHVRFRYDGASAQAR